MCAPKCPLCEHRLQCCTKQSCSLTTKGRLQASVLLCNDTLLPPFDHVPSSVAVPWQQLCEDLRLARCAGGALQRQGTMSGAALAEAAWLQRVAAGSKLDDKDATALTHTGESCIASWWPWAACALHAAHVASTDALQLP